MWRSKLIAVSHEIWFGLAALVIGALGFIYGRKDRTLERQNQVKQQIETLANAVFEQKMLNHSDRLSRLEQTVTQMQQSQHDMARELAEKISHCATKEMMELVQRENQRQTELLLRLVDKSGRGA